MWIHGPLGSRVRLTAGARWMSLRSGFEAAPVAAAGIVLYPRGSKYTTIVESGSPKP